MHPCKVPDDYLHRYSGRYDDGYDALRERRFEELKRAGIVAADARIPPRNPAIMPWSELSESRRRVEARKMELYAALVENLDVHVGRLLDYLRTEGLSKNTLVIFLSDNGAAAEGFYNRGIRMPYVRRHYDNDYDNMGKPGSWVFLRRALGGKRSGTLRGVPLTQRSPVPLTTPWLSDQAPRRRSTRREASPAQLCRRTPRSSGTPARGLR